MLFPATNRKNRKIVKQKKERRWRKYGPEIVG